MQLPWNTAEYRLSGCLQACMGIADDELHTSQASLHQALQEGTPVDFLLAERYGKSQFLSFSIEGNPAGNQHGGIPDLLIKPALFVQGIL
ncbi:MAG: hypothetical protein WA997_16150, partial [Anaerolineales bacterium]